MSAKESLFNARLSVPGDFRVLKESIKEDLLELSKAELGAGGDTPESTYEEQDSTSTHPTECLIDLSPVAPIVHTVETQTTMEFRTSTPLDPLPSAFQCEPGYDITNAPKKPRS